jgi:UPF0716 protein FxsA
MLPLLLLLFIVVPLVELYVIIQVGQAIGPLPTIGLLLLDSIVGSLLLRAQGRSAWRRFNRAIGSGRVPAREVADGALIIFGGALLLTPGFVTDVFGLLFLLPPTRAGIRRLILRRATFGILGGRPPGDGGRRPRGYDVEGTAVESEPEQLP